MLRSAKNNIKKYNTPTPSPHLLDIHHPICLSNEIPDHPDYIKCVPTWNQPIDNIALEELYSDPGSDLTSEITRYLQLWLGQKHVFSIVQRHQSNRVEPTNKKILSLARCMIHDNRMKHQCNSKIHSETRFSAFELKYRTVDALMITCMIKHLLQ
jgi:hypothetical protein